MKTTSPKLLLLAILAFPIGVPLIWLTAHFAEQIDTSSSTNALASSIVVIAFLSILGFKLIRR